MDSNEQLGDEARQTPGSIPDDPSSRLAETNTFDVAPTEPFRNTQPGTAAADKVGRVFGDYDMLDKLGAGGMGVVYLARQRSANRLVALKLIRPERLDALSQEKRQGWLDRFRAEAQAAARLEHDNVVPVYDVGELGGTLYYSMRYVDGQSLADVVRGGPLENRRAARLIYGVSRAVDHAHRLGILHRDLKPQNILVRRSQSEKSSGVSFPSTAGFAKSSATTSELLADERPYVADFGLAKWLEEGAGGATHTGEVIGTPSYMSPEQAQDASRCTAASDIYSLGATLYDLLTGRPPFRAVSPVETLRQVIYEDPVSPRDLNRAIDRDLETIALKALAKEPSRRYATAGEMADDLGRYLNGQPILARPVGPVERAYQFARRNPVIAALAAGVGVLLLIVAAGSLAYSFELGRYAQREHQARSEAEDYFRMTLNAIDGMLTEVGEDSLKHVPQMERVRQELLQKARDLYNQLLKSQPADSQLQFEFARAQQRLGDIYDLLGQHDEAKDAYTAAIHLFNRLRASSPNDLQVQRYLAVSHNMLGESFRKTEPGQAESHFEDALEIQRELHQLEPQNIDFRQELSLTLNNRGLLLTESGEYESAESNLNAAIELLQEVTEIENASLDCLNELCRSQINLGFLLGKQPGRIVDTEQVCRAAIDNLQQLTKRDPQNHECRHFLGVAMLNLGNLLMHVPPGQSAETARERRLESVQWMRSANSNLLELCNDFRSTPKYWYDLANSHNSLANALIPLGSYDDAKTQLDYANQVLDQLSSDFPAFEQVADCHYLKGIVLGSLGGLEREINKNPEAAQTYIKQAIAQQRAAIKVAPDNPAYMERLLSHQSYLAQILDQLGLNEEAEKMRGEAEKTKTQVETMKAKGLKSP